MSTSHRRPICTARCYALTYAVQCGRRRAQHAAHLPADLARLALAPPAAELPEDVLASIEAARHELDLGEVDYEATMAAKLGIARRVFDEQGQETLKVCVAVM